MRAFDAAAAGYVRSEGAGIVLLKPLSAALADHDPIYAIIRGSAVNQNGTSNGLTAPSRAAQEQVLREAYARAASRRAKSVLSKRKAPARVWATRSRPPRLGMSCGRTDRRGSRAALGAVKTNIGHLEAASGIASLMKAALALKHRQLPPNLHFQSPNPDIPFDALPLKLPGSLEPWPDAEHPRFAGVSAFGFGGSNAHVVLEEPPDSAGESLESPERETRLLPLSARTDKAVRDLADRYHGFLSGGSPPWSDICHTAGSARPPRLPPGRAGRFGRTGRASVARVFEWPDDAGRLFWPKTFRSRAESRFCLWRSGRQLATAGSEAGSIRHGICRGN